MGDEWNDSKEGAQHCREDSEEKPLESKVSNTLLAVQPDEAKQPERDTPVTVWPEGWNPLALDVASLSGHVQHARAMMLMANLESAGLKVSKSMVAAKWLVAYYSSPPATL